MGGQRDAPAALSPGKTLVYIVPEAGWASEAVWTGAEYRAPTGIRPPRTVKPVAIHHTDYAFPALECVNNCYIWETRLPSCDITSWRRTSAPSGGTGYYGTLTSHTFGTIRIWNC